MFGANPFNVAAGLKSMSAKLFCNCSYVPFRSLGESRGERRTANAQRWTSKNDVAMLRKLSLIQWQTLKGYFCFLSAVLILETNILINSSVSCKISSNSSGLLMSGTPWISFNHLWLSLSYFKTIRSLWMKSLWDSAAWASPWFGYGEVPALNNWPATWLLTLVFGSFSTIFIIRTEYSSSLSSRSYVCFFNFSPSTFDVRCWMFIFSISLRK